MLIEENLNKIDHRLRIFCGRIKPAYLVGSRVQRSRHDHRALVPLFLRNGECVLLLNKCTPAVFLDSQGAEFVNEEEKLVFLKISKSAQNQIHLFAVLGIGTREHATRLFYFVASFPNYAPGGAF
jgi:hypothetical protein